MDRGTPHWDSNKKLKALTLQQPWAWAVLQTDLPGFPKDIENRGKKTKLRERILIHAGKTYDHEGAAWILKTFGVEAPGPEALPMGYIVGSVEIVGCVDEHPSKWFMGPYGYVLLNPIEIDPRPYRGMPGFFNVEEKTGAGL